MREGKEIEVVNIGDGVLISMPPVPPMFWFRAPTRGRRVFAWVFGGFALFMIVGGWWGIGDMFLKLGRFLPVNNWADVLLLVGMGIPILMFAGMALVMTGVLGGAFFEERLEIEVNRKEVIERCRGGPFRMRRRVPVHRIKSVGVRAPQTTSEATLHKPLEARRARVCLSGEESWTWYTRCSYQHPIAMGLAQEICSALGEVRTVGTAGADAKSGTSITFEDGLDPLRVNENVESRPEGVNVVLEESGKGCRIECGRGELHVIGLLKNPTFRAGLWAVLLGVGFLFVAPHLPDPVGIMRKLSWICLVFAGGQGMMLMGLVVYGRLVWVSYEIDSEQLRRTVHGVVFRRRRSWKRQEIAAVRLGERSGDKNRHRDVLELLMQDGNQVVVAGGGLLYLRYLATLLRRELGVGSEAEVPVLDPRDPRWHLLDEPERPEKFKYDVVEADGRLVVSRKWKGFTRGEVILLTSWLGITIGAAVMVPLFALPHAKDADDVHGIWAIAVCAMLFAAVMIVVALCDIVERWVLVATPEEISFNRRTLFQQRSGHWLTNELRAVRTEAQFPGNPMTSVRMVLVKTDGEEKLMAGNANVYRYLATLLRRATGLPATVAGGRAAICGIEEGSR